MLKALFILFASTAFAQTTASDVWNTVKSYTVERKNDALAYGRKLVNGTDRQIKSLESRAAKASGEAKAQLDSDIRELKAKRAAASKKLDEMGKATGAAWDEAKDGFADAYRDLQDSYEKARRKLK